MKMLKNHILLYDAHCPMCRVYTKAFVRAGLLDEEGRTPYQAASSVDCAQVDWQRAVNEIALVDRKSGAVSYGVQSLFKVLAHAIPLMAPVFRFRPFAWMAAKAYSLISYNRRVIMPAKEDSQDLPPAFRLSWRLVWIVFSWLLTGWILHRYSTHLEGVIPRSSFFREFLICGGQIIWQGALIAIYRPPKTWDYLGNMMTVSFAGGLSLALISFLLVLFKVANPWVFAGAFATVAGLMLLEHARRCRLLKLGWIMSVSWVLYRLVLLYFILR